jgi:hypothetical protein
MCKSLKVMENISRSKNKNHIEAEKAFNKIKEYFMIKAPRNLGVEGMYLNIIKVIQPTSYLMGKNETISSKVKKDTRLPTLPSTAWY